MRANVTFILTNKNYASYSSFLYTYYLILRSSYISIIYKQYIGISVASVASVVLLVASEVWSCRTEQ